MKYFELATIDTPNGKVILEECVKTSMTVSGDTHTTIDYAVYGGSVNGVYNVTKERALERFNEILNNSIVNR